MEACNPSFPGIVEVTADEFNDLLGSACGEPVSKEIGLLMKISYENYHATIKQN